MWVLYPNFLSEDLFFSNSRRDGGARPLLDTHMALYCNNNSFIFKV